MKVILVLLAIVAVALALFAISSIPDIIRYWRIRNM